LIEPLKETSTGITGPLMVNNFLVFFCVAMRRELFEEIGLLDEVFTPGYGEDIDFCIRTRRAGYKLVQVPDEKLTQKNGTNIGSFPIYHTAEATVHDIPDWNEIKNKRCKNKSC
jgi:GT2 family glycosyltransferase